MTRCRAESFYLSPQDKRSFSAWTIAARLPDGRLQAITHRNDLARLERAHPDWNHEVVVAPRSAAPTLTALQALCVDGQTDRVWLDSRTVEGRNTVDTRRPALFSLATTGPAAADRLGGARPVAEALFGRPVRGGGATGPVVKAVGAALTADNAGGAGIEMLSFASACSLILDPDKIAALMALAPTSGTGYAPLDPARLAQQLADILSRYPAARRAALLADLWDLAHERPWWRVVDEVRGEHDPQGIDDYDYRDDYDYGDDRDPDWAAQHWTVEQIEDQIAALTTLLANGPDAVEPELLPTPDVLAWRSRAHPVEDRSLHGEIDPTDLTSRAQAAAINPDAAFDLSHSLWGARLPEGSRPLEDIDPDLVGRLCRQNPWLLDHISDSLLVQALAAEPDLATQLHHERFVRPHVLAAVAATEVNDDLITVHTSELPHEVLAAWQRCRIGPALPAEAHRAFAQAKLAEQVNNVVTGRLDVHPVLYADEDTLRTLDTPGKARAYIQAVGDSYEIQTAARENPYIAQQLLFDNDPDLREVAVTAIASGALPKKVATALYTSDRGLDLLEDIGPRVDSIDGPAIAAHAIVQGRLDELSPQTLSTLIEAGLPIDAVLPTIEQAVLASRGGVYGALDQVAARTTNPAVIAELLNQYAPPRTLLEREDVRPVVLQHLEDQVLGASGSAYVRKELLARHSRNPQVLAKLRTDADPEVRAQLAARGDLLPEQRPVSPLVDLVEQAAQSARNGTTPDKPKRWREMLAAPATDSYTYRPEIAEVDGTALPGVQDSRVELFSNDAELHANAEYMQNCTYSYRHYMQDGSGAILKVEAGGARYNVHVERAGSRWVLGEVNSRFNEYNVPEQVSHGCQQLVDQLNERRRAQARSVAQVLAERQIDLGIDVNTGEDLRELVLQDVEMSLSAPRPNARQARRRGRRAGR